MMRNGVGFIETAVAVSSVVSTGLSVASFFGGGSKKKPQITAAQNQSMYEQSAAKTVNGTLPGIQRRMAAATTLDAIYSERDVFPRIFENAMAKSLKSYSATFGQAGAEAAVKNLRSWQKPIYDQGQAVVEQMIAERIGQLDAPAKAVKAMQDQMAAEQRFASTLAAAVQPSGPSTSTILLIVGGLAAAWFLTKGK